MAEHKESVTEEKDPIVEGTLLWPIFLAVVALLLAGGWALYDEAYTRRPYKGYQNDWVKVARKAYEAKRAQAEASYREVTSRPEYLELKAAYEEARDAAGAPYKALQDELSKAILPRLAMLSEPVKIARSESAALTFRVDQAGEHNDAAKQARYLSELAAVENRRTKFVFPGETEAVEWNLKEMGDEFNRLKTLQGTIQGEMARVKRAESATRKAMNDYVDLHMVGPKPDAIDKLLVGLDDFNHEIKQIHIKYSDGELVERCESCHLGIRSPIDLDLADVGGRPEFTSHPHADTLLKIHDPEVMGCSPCHGGNGIGVTSVAKAHGRYKHWLWPLHAKENVEAGCFQCHSQDLYLDHAEVFNEGKRLYQWRGCVGCHLHESFVSEEAEEKRLSQLREHNEKATVETLLDIQNLTAVTQSPDAAEEAITEAFTAIEKRNQQMHLLREQATSLGVQWDGLQSEKKDVGPNLKEVASKLKPEWLHPWLVNARAFRHDTKMPQFRIDDEQAWDIAAYLWQKSNPVPVAEIAPGDAERGEQLITTRGCMGCHNVSTSEYEDGIGSHFAANLSRMGEKANFEYLASWLKNPRHHNPYTVMPSLRLSDQDASDIASFLVSKVNEDATYSSAEDVLPVLMDPARLASGEKLIRHLGCAGCHQIEGLENEDRVGVELTQEGSKPIERLDFGTLTHDYKKAKKYDHKHFFEDKLRKPDIWDTGKYRPQMHYFERLKMPNFFTDVEPLEVGGERRRPMVERELKAIASKEEKSDEDQARMADLERQLQVYTDIDALTTFLIGSVEANIPPSLLYQPEGLAKDIQDGWWVVKKYNCQGCHQFRPGEMPDIWKLDIYQDGTGFPGVPDRNGRPPTLIGQGTRTDPGWLSSFLLDPSLSGDLPNGSERNGVRQGLAVRMPTYYLSERERGKLVRFFTALSQTSHDYVRPDVPPLEGDLLEVGRAAFIAGDCANCHLLGGETEINPSTTYAPSFSPVARRIRPAWHYRWITEPSSVIPGTAMPSLLTQVENDDGTSRWVFATEKISEAAKRRLGDERLRKLSEYEGDHATLLMRYFAHWTDSEGAYQKAQR
jgi:mono/diheme cytochrome c family protein